MMNSLQYLNELNKEIRECIQSLNRTIDINHRAQRAEERIKVLKHEISIYTHHLALIKSQNDIYAEQFLCKTKELLNETHESLLKSLPQGLPEGKPDTWVIAAPFSANYPDMERKPPSMRGYWDQMISRVGQEYVSITSRYKYKPQLSVRAARCTIAELKVEMHKFEKLKAAQLLVSQLNVSTEIEHGLELMLSDVKDEISRNKMFPDCIAEYHEYSDKVKSILLPISGSREPQGSEECDCGTLELIKPEEIDYENIVFRPLNMKKKPSDVFRPCVTNMYSLKDYYDQALLLFEEEKGAFSPSAKRCGSATSYATPGTVSTSELDHQKPGSIRLKIKS